MGTPMRFFLLTAILLSSTSAFPADPEESVFFKKTLVDHDEKRVFCGFTLGGSMAQAVKEVPRSMRFKAHKKEGDTEMVLFAGGPLKGTDITVLIFVDAKLAMVQVHLPNQRFALIELAERKYAKREYDGRVWHGVENGIMVTVSDKGVNASDIQLLNKLSEYQAEDLGSL